MSFRVFLSLNDINFWRTWITKFRFRRSKNFMLNFMYKVQSWWNIWEIWLQRDSMSLWIFLHVPKNSPHQLKHLTSSKSFQEVGKSLTNTHFRDETRKLWPVKNRATFRANSLCSLRVFINREKHWKSKKRTSSMKNWTSVEISQK